MDNNDEALSALHKLLTEELTKRLTDPETAASTLNVARQFLKDNDITIDPDSAKEAGMDKLTDAAYPFAIPDVKGSGTREDELDGDGTATA